MPTTTVKDVMTTGPTSIANDAMVVEAAAGTLEVADDIPHPRGKPGGPLPVDLWLQ
jgi:hypothetical protein